MLGASSTRAEYLATDGMAMWSTWPNIRLTQALLATQPSMVQHDSYPPILISVIRQYPRSASPRDTSLAAFPSCFLYFFVFLLLPSLPDCLLVSYKPRPRIAVSFSKTASNSPGNISQPLPKPFGTQMGGTSRRLTSAWYNRVRVV